MNKELLSKIKEFAEENFCADNPTVIADDKEFAVTNPWMDHTGRYYLSDADAVIEWGLDTLIDFCKKAEKEIDERAKKPVLCGFVYCHGNKDFSAWEVQLKKEDREAIERILSAYVIDGTSERNAWDCKISDVFSEEY